ncbi:MAG: DUF6838 family protein [Clostridioides difficile]
MKVCKALKGLVFFVSILSVICTPIMLNTNNKDIVISIKYLPKPQSKSIRMYEISDELNKLFNRNIKVTDRKLNITKLEQSIKKEESIYVLNFTFTLNYLDSVYEEDVVYENMEEINLNLGE